MAAKLSLKTADTAGSLAAKIFEEIPGPTLWPLVGSALNYRFGNYKKTEYHVALLDMYQRYGPVVREKIGGKNIVHVFDPEDIKTVYSVEGKYPVVPPLQETTQMYRAQKSMSLGLGNTNGEEWYKLRANCIQKMLRPKEVSFHLPSVDRTANLLIDRLDQGRDKEDYVSDLRVLIGSWSIENAAKLVFDSQLGCLEPGSSQEDWACKLVEANAEIFRLSGDLKLSLPFYKYISTPKWRRLIGAEDYFYTEAISLVDKALLRLKDSVEENASSEEDFDFLSYLLSRQALDLKDVTVICLSLFSDGLSTTTPTLLFNLYSLAKQSNIELQERLYDEVSNNLPIDKPISQQDLSNLPLLKGFVKETFRIYPNGTEVSRYIEKDLVLSGYNIPSGTHVDLNPSVHFKNPELFPEPDQHKPERWLREGSGNDIHPYLLIPFGHGTRMCAGRRFAEQDLYVVLARIISRYRLVCTNINPINQMYNTLLFPDQPLSIKFIPRK